MDKAYHLVKSSKQFLRLQSKYLSSILFDLFAFWSSLWTKNIPIVTEGYPCNDGVYLWRSNTTWSWRLGKKKKIAFSLCLMWSFRWPKQSGVGSTFFSSGQHFTFFFFLIWMWNFNSRRSSLNCVTLISTIKKYNIVWFWMNFKTL